MSSSVFEHKPVSHYLTSCSGMDELNKKDHLLSHYGDETEEDSSEQVLSLTPFVKERYRQLVPLDQSSSPHLRDVENVIISSTTPTRDSIGINKSHTAVDETLHPEISNSDIMTTTTTHDGQQTQTNFNSTNSLSGPLGRVHKPLAKRQDSSTLDVDLKASSERGLDLQRNHQNDEAEQTEGQQTGKNNEPKSLGQEQQVLTCQMQDGNGILLGSLSQLPISTCQNYPAQTHSQNQPIIAQGQGSAASSTSNFRRSFSQPQTRDDDRHDLAPHSSSSFKKFSSAQQAEELTSSVPAEDGRLTRGKNLNDLTLGTSSNLAHGCCGVKNSNTDDQRRWQVAYGKTGMFTQSLEPLRVDIEKNDTANLKLKSHNSNGPAMTSRGKGYKRFLSSMSHERLVFLVFGLLVIIFLQGCAMGLVGKEARDLHHKVQVLELRINKLEKLGLKLEQDSRPSEKEFLNLPRGARDHEYVYNKVLAYANHPDDKSRETSGHGNSLLFDDKNSHASESRQSSKHGFSANIRQDDSHVENLQLGQKLDTQNGHKSSFDSPDVAHSATLGKKIVVNSVSLSSGHSQEYRSASSQPGGEMHVGGILENPELWEFDDDDDDFDAEDFDDDDDGDDNDDDEDADDDDTEDMEEGDINDTQNTELSSDGSLAAAHADQADGFQKKGMTHSRHARAADKAKKEEKTGKWTCDKLKQRERRKLRHCGKSKIVSETFESEFYKMFDYTTHFKDSDCIAVENWPKVKAKACKNAGIEFENKGTALPIYNSTATKKKNKLFDTKDEMPGAFITKNTGLYLVHLNITLVDETNTHYLVLYLNGKPMLACQDGGFPCPHTNRQNSAKYRICTIGGLLQLSKDDIIEIKTMEDNTMVRLESHAKSYFRAVMLEGEKNKRKKRSKNKRKAEA